MAKETPVETAKIEIKHAVVEKINVGLGGWLAFVIVMLGLNVIGWVWAFFVAIIVMTSGPSGVGLAVAIETLLLSLVLTGLSGFTLFLIVNRRKLGVLFAYITLGVSALYATIVAVTTMFTTHESCSYSGYSYYYSSWSPTCTTTRGGLLTCCRWLSS